MGLNIHKSFKISTYIYPIIWVNVPAFIEKFSKAWKCNTKRREIPKATQRTANNCVTDLLRFKEENEHWILWLLDLNCSVWALNYVFIIPGSFFNPFWNEPLLMERAFRTGLAWNDFRFHLEGALCILISFDVSE